MVFILVLLLKRFCWVDARILTMNLMAVSGAPRLPFSEGQVLIVPVKGNSGVSCEAYISVPPIPPKDLPDTPPCADVTNPSSEILAQPLPNTSPPATPSCKDRSFFIGKRRRTTSAPVASGFKPCRPSVATVRKTNRRIMDESVGEGAQITPMKKALCDELRKVYARIGDLQKENDHLKALSKHPDLDSILRSLISPTLRLLVLANIRNQHRKGHGRRWTMDEKLRALSIFKRSPKAYRYLCMLFVLPSVRTLQRVLQLLPMTPGINRRVIKHVSQRLKPNSVKDNCIILMFDEMYIKKRLLYNENSGLVEGFEDYGMRKGADGRFYHDRRSGIADHVLVFQVQGLCRRYKQPVGYHFISGTVSSADLATLIREYIEVLQENGFNVIATVCDQGPTNRGALCRLKKSTPGGQGLKGNYFEVGGCKIFPLFDVPHLFKSLRNNFMSSTHIVWNNTIAKYNDIVEAIKFQPDLFKLKQMTIDQIRPKGRKKMKVKWAMKTLSSSTSAFLQTLHDCASRGQFRRRNYFQGTAIVVKEFDKLCDYINGPGGPHDIKRKIRENVSAKSDHIQVWREMSEKMFQMEFHKYDKKKKKVVIQRPPCQNGFVSTLQNLERIWLKLHLEYKFDYLNLRQLNQDPLENLFSVIRQHGVTCDNPTCGHFSAALKSSVITRLTSYKSAGGNTAGDDAELLSDLRDLLTGSENNDFEEETQIDCDGLYTFFDDPVAADDTDAEQRRALLKLLLPQNDLSDEEVEADLLDLGDILSQAPTYVAGYIGLKLSAKLKCRTCASCLSADEVSVRHTFTQAKEYYANGSALFYACAGLSKYVENAMNSFKSKVTDKLHQPNIKDYIKHDLILVSDYSWLTCSVENHFQAVIDKLNAMLSRMLMHAYCRRRNEEFKKEEEKLKIAREAEKAAAQKRRAEELAARKAQREQGIQRLEAIKRKTAAAAALKRKKAEAPVSGHEQGTPCKKTRAQIIVESNPNNVWNDRQQLTAYR